MTDTAKQEFKRVPEADLNKEAATAAAYYIQEKMKGAPMHDRIQATNYVAHGFYMGYRKKEEQIGAVADGKSGT